MIRRPVLHYTWKTSAAEDLPKRGSISLDLGHGGAVSNVSFSNIVIEDHDTDRPVIVVKNDDLGDGSSPVSSVTFRGINAVRTKSATPQILLAEYAGAMKGLLFDDVRLNGSPVSSKRDDRFWIVGSPSYDVIP